MRLIPWNAFATFLEVSRHHLEPADAFALREEELLGNVAMPLATRREVRSIPGQGLSPLLSALRSQPKKVTWIASRLASPPFLCLLQSLDHHANLHLDIVAPFGDECFPDPLSRALASVLETWSDHWQLHVFEGPTYPGHVFIVDRRVLLCRDPLLTPTPDSPDWVDVELDTLPSLQRRLRRRRSACRLLAPGSLYEPLFESISLPELPLPASHEEEKRRNSLSRLLEGRKSRKHDAMASADRQP